MCVWTRSDKGNIRNLEGIIGTSRYYVKKNESHSSSVSIATRLRTVRPEFDSCQGPGRSSFFEFFGIVTPSSVVVGYRRFIGLCCLHLQGEMILKCRIFFSSLLRPDRHWSPPSLPSSEYRGLFFRGAKRPGREGDYLPPSSAEIKKTSYTSIPQYVFEV
jgi:hypothetical protein